MGCKELLEKELQDQIQFYENFRNLARKLYDWLKEGRYSEKIENLLKDDVEEDQKERYRVSPLFIFRDLLAKKNLPQGIKRIAKELGVGIENGLGWASQYPDFESKEEVKAVLDKFFGQCVAGTLDKETMEQTKEVGKNKKPRALLPCLAFVIRPDKYFPYNDPVEKFVNKAREEGKLELVKEMPWEDPERWSEFVESEEFIEAVVGICCGGDPEVRDKLQELKEKEKFKYRVAMNYIIWTWNETKNNSVARKETKIGKLLASSGLKMDEKIASAFFHALRTKGFVLLAGTTGTGKTKLAREFAKTVSSEGLKILPFYLCSTGEARKHAEFSKRAQDIMRQHGYFYYGWDRDIGNQLNKETKRFVLLMGKSLGDDIAEAYLIDGWYGRTEFPENWTELYPADDADKQEWILKVVKVFKLKKPLRKENIGINKYSDKLRRLSDEAVEKVIKVMPQYYLFISVRPDWTDSSALLGWFNPIGGEDGKGKFEKGLALDFLLDAALDYKDNSSGAMPYFLILDEMNLAHIEYYFADFLSVLESGRDEKGWTEEGIKLGVKVGQLDEETRRKFERLDLQEDQEAILPLPPNLYIIGTLNTDETTKSLSPKVLDRAFVFEFWDVDLEEYPPEGQEGNLSSEGFSELVRDLSFPFEDDDFNGAFLAHIGNKPVLNEKVKKFKEMKKSKENEDYETYWKDLQNLMELLKPHDLHFGYRVVDEIALFVLAAKNSSFASMGAQEAFDIAVCSKVLPKFSGTRGRLEKPLLKVLAWAEGKDAKDIKGKDTNKEISQDNIDERIDEVTKQLRGNASQSAGKEGENAENQTNSQPEEGNQQEGANEKTYNYPRTALKALRMLRRLYEEGFASYF